jgi:predicted O-methyltransferase YrrM
MTEPSWEEVDRFVERQLIAPDDGLDGALAASDAAGLPSIQVSPLQGKFLHLLVASLGVHRALEVGTLGGFSTIWIARGLAPGGRVVTLELEPKHAEVARANLVRAGVGDRVEIRLGPALASLAKLVEEHAEPFDFVFLDADKPSTAEYFDAAMRLTHPGSVLVVDNVVRGGSLADLQRPDPSAEGMRRFLAQLAAEPRASGTVLQTVGRKGHDGFALVRVVRA